MAQLDIRVIRRPTGHDRVWVDLIIETNVLDMIVRSWVWTGGSGWHWVPAGGCSPNTATGSASHPSR